MLSRFELDPGASLFVPAEALAAFSSAVRQSLIVWAGTSKHLKMGRKRSSACLSLPYTLVLPRLFDKDFVSTVHVVVCSASS